MLIEDVFSQLSTSCVYTRGDWSARKKTHQRLTRGGNTRSPCRRTDGDKVRLPYCVLLARQGTAPPRRPTRREFHKLVRGDPPSLTAASSTVPLRSPAPAPLTSGPWASVQLHRLRTGPAHSLQAEPYPRRIGATSGVGGPGAPHPHFPLDGHAYVHGCRRT